MNSTGDAALITLEALKRLGEDERAGLLSALSPLQIAIEKEVARLTTAASRLPVDSVVFDIRIHRGAYRGIESTETNEQLETPELVLHRIFHLSKA
jgi:hypothetical protein